MKQHIDPTDTVHGDLPGLTPGRSARRRRFKRAVLISLLALLVLGEVGARVLANEWSRFNMFVGAHREFDPERKIRLRAGYESRGISINSRGFLGPEVDPTGPPGGVRVVTLGDSCSFSPTNLCWPRAFEGALQDLVRDRPVEVINASCGGYSSWQSRMWYESEVIDYEHEVLVIYIGWNDMGQYNPEGMAFKLDEEGYLDQPTLLQRAFVSCYLLRSLYVVQGWLESRGPVSFDPLTEDEEALYADFRPTHFEENLVGLIEMARARGRSVYLMNYAGLVVESPTANEQDRMHFPRGIGRSLTKYRRLMDTYESSLARVAAATGTRVLDIKSLFPTPREREVFTDSCHFDETASARIGQHVAQVVADALEAPAPRDE